MLGDLSARNMSTNDHQTPLSKEELTKLASLAIEAKEKAYCKWVIFQRQGGPQW